MTLKKLLQTNSWLSIAAILKHLYPNETSDLSGYKEVFEKLLLMDSKNSDISIDVVKQKDDFDGEDYVDISETYKNQKNQKERFSQAIEFTPWNQWLGMEISPESFIHFSELEIFSHCLYKLTFIGFEQEDIRDESGRIESTIENYKYDR